MIVCGVIEGYTFKTILEGNAMAVEYIVAMKKNGITGFSDGMTEDEADEMIRFYLNDGYEFVSKSSETI